MDDITVRRLDDVHEITIADYYGTGFPLVFDLNDDQATHLRAQLRPNLRRYVVTTPAKARMTGP